MNKSKLKSYAPQARKDFIAMVQSRAAQLGIAEVNGQLQVQPCEVQGQVAIIAGQAFPAKIANQRQALIARMQKEGFAATVDAIAYTWFNRFAALRYMELHNYLGHGQRVLSSVVEGGLPDILTHALELVSAGDLPGVSVDDVSQLKLAGKDGELYKRLLVAQCNQLAGHMGFLFERIEDDSELLLPDNLLRTDSVVRKLVDSIDEPDWQQVEIIGWLYQFYISEKKDQVIGKVVKSADIPAATQLFTPNWIVKYLVQNSVGRLWLQANPGSTLASQMAYYIQSAEQTHEVHAQLSALVQARIAEDGDTLNPESITVLDPACGSGHILVEAYDLLKAIYLERGYRERDIPRLILQKNLFGLDIDDRAAQLAGFALLMKARADDRRLLADPENPPKINVLALQESKGLNIDEIVTHLAPFGVQGATVRALVDTFEHAKTFGSLIQISDSLKTHLNPLAEILEKVQVVGDLYAKVSAAELAPMVLQAKLLVMQFDSVIANPPYMGNGGMNEALRLYVEEYYKEAKSDLFSCFMIRSQNMRKETGIGSMVTMQSWMFLSSFESLRKKILQLESIASMVHIGFNSFPEINSKIALATAFTTLNKFIENYSGIYIDLNSEEASTDKNIAFLNRDNNIYTVPAADFLGIPGCPISYSASNGIRKAFSTLVPLGQLASPRKGMVTADNPRFIRHWHEVSFKNIEFHAKSFLEAKENCKKWFPYSKGGGFRRWAGNDDFVVNWENGGHELLNMKGNGYKVGSTNHNLDYIFKPAIVWTKICIDSAFRYVNGGTLFDDASGLCPVKDSKNLPLIIGLLNSPVATTALNVLNPTLNLNPGNLATIPVDTSIKNEEIIKECIKISKTDWDLFERSWSFQKSPLITNNMNQNTELKIEDSYNHWIKESESATNRLMELEILNAQKYISAYNLTSSLSSLVDISEISITVNPYFRYKGIKSVEESKKRFLQDSVSELIGYTIGCIMGRYSLDEPGLIYAHAGNEGFDPARYATFPADADGIVPVSDMAWFADDATSRVIEFVEAVWGKDTLAENLAWLADSLGRKADESPEDALRRYISGSFFKDHCQTYKKRPIYWLFSSGKQKAFEALVYLHRYNDTTLARMRAEYVVPLTGRMAERIQLLEDDALKATTSASRKSIDKQIDKLKKKLEELRQYDEKLRHFADQRITLDLDDGVKVNYGKFGDLLDNVKAITGGAGDD